MIKSWDDFAWEDYLYWQVQDKKTLKRINQLLQDIDRNGYTGIGKPEPLKGNLQGYWSRRIDEVNRLVYRIADNRIEILQCRSYYHEFKHDYYNFILPFPTSSRNFSTSSFVSLDLP